ncbi:hypothetical protein MFLO_10683 [Listeria floridensis FSL S10-1187]|uniref:MucBP domain-containing protein n=1 Tax=Listeria floridensis FSL S10-1187 TaxID=1265817 RepID=A0ABP3AYE3_9LIST|nr:hypothetical protein MFLO_10683 [Listeria floridensis FSL S10-1187]
MQNTSGNVNGTFGTKPQTMILTYGKSQGQVTINYQDGQGNVIKKTAVLKEDIGSHYVATAKDIPGYRLRRISGNQPGEFRSEDEPVTFVYAKIVSIATLKRDRIALMEELGSKKPELGRSLNRSLLEKKRLKLVLRKIGSLCRLKDVRTESVFHRRQESVAKVKYRQTHGSLPSTGDVDSVFDIVIGALLILESKDLLGTIDKRKGV